MTATIGRDRAHPNPTTSVQNELKQLRRDLERAEAAEAKEQRRLDRPPVDRTAVAAELARVLAEHDQAQAAADKELLKAREDLEAHSYTKALRRVQRAETAVDHFSLTGGTKGSRLRHQLFESAPHEDIEAFKKELQAALYEIMLAATKPDSAARIGALTAAIQRCGNLPFVPDPIPIIHAERKRLKVGKPSE